MSETFFCRYGCGKKIVWVIGHKMPIESTDNGSNIIEHTFKRCADLQKEQGRKPFFFDRSKTENK